MLTSQSGSTAPDWPGGSGKQCRLCQSTYKMVSANGLISYLRNVAIIMLTFFLFFFKDCHEKVIPGKLSPFV